MHPKTMHWIGIGFLIAVAATVLIGSALGIMAFSHQGTTDDRIDYIFKALQFMSKQQ